LRNAVPFGKALQDFAELRLRLTPIGVELFQPVARIGAALENMRRAWRQWMLVPINAPSAAGRSRARAAR
jgi:hypothetical protein